MPCLRSAQAREVRPAGGATGDPREQDVRRPSPGLLGERVPPVRLEQRPGPTDTLPGERPGEAADVSLERGLQVRVDDCRVPPLVLAPDRRHVVREGDGHTWKHILDDVPDTNLVLRVQVREEGADGDRHVAPVEIELPQRLRQPLGVQRSLDLPLLVEPLHDPEAVWSLDER